MQSKGNFVSFVLLNLVVTLMVMSLVGVVESSSGSLSTRELLAQKQEYLKTVKAGLHEVQTLIHADEIYPQDIRLSGYEQLKKRTKSELFDVLKTVQYEVDILSKMCSERKGRNCDDKIEQSPTISESINAPAVMPQVIAKHPSIILKESQAAPSAPSLSSRTTTSITLTPDSTMEFRRSGGAWQQSNVFSGLKVGTSYSFSRRIRETTRHEASAESSVVTFTTEKESQAAPSAPTMSSRNSTSITLTPDSTMEYRRSGGAWQQNNVFSNLSPSTTHSITRRSRETATQKASPESASVSLTTLARQSAPSAPRMTCHTSTTITLAADSTLEFRRNGSDWQQSNVFSNLSPATTYSITSRRRATASLDASPQSAPVSFTTRARNSIVPELTSNNSHGMVVTASSIHAQYHPYFAFVPISECNIHFTWISRGVTSERSNGWVQIDLGSNNLHRLTGYAITNVPSATLTRIRSFRLMGSTNGSSWTTLHTGNTPSDGRFTFNFSNNNSWRFIRLQSLTTNNVNSWTAVPYLELFGNKV